MARDYTTLIASEHANAPKFRAMVAMGSAAFGDAADASAALAGEFDLDDAVGVQLDVVGLWVGFSRYVETPIADGYFAWDTAGLGWGEGYWAPPFAPTEGLVALDDDTYRQMLRAKIAANHYDGSFIAYQAVLTAMFAGTGTTAKVIDNQDMTLTIELSGATVPPVVLAILGGDSLPIKPSGVNVTVTVV